MDCSVKVKDLFPSFICIQNKNFQIPGTVFWFNFGLWIFFVIGMDIVLFTWKTVPSFLNVR